MIEITAKALRFARLAAEQQPAFARDPLIADIRREEEAFARRPLENRVGDNIRIPEGMADFCGRALGSFLKMPHLFGSDDWDANDFLFMQTAAQSLRHQLMKSSARAL